ncbi:MAG: hypothetical protein PHQ95_00800 [Candidatus Gracilibacteria bacterium]|nr:hypothetical protein [Candidatus Gracilibacteria bacterium]
MLPLWRPEIEMIERMRDYLFQNLLGQQEAINEVCDLFIARSVRSNSDRRPFMTVFLNGTSGVGKTLMFELIGNFLAQEEERKGSGCHIPVTKFSLNGVFAFEVPEMLYSLNPSARNPGDSKKCKCEVLFEQACESDPFFGRQVQIWDEWEKLNSSPNHNYISAFNVISEIFEDAIPTPKHPDAISMDFSNTIFVITSNLFLNSVRDPKRSIGFATPEESKPVIQDESFGIDKEEILEKLRRHFSVSSFNRVDKFVQFRDISGFGDMRRDFAEKEVRKMFGIIDDFYEKRGNPLPAIEQYKSFDQLVQEALDNCEKSGGFRAIKRYIENIMIGRILSLLHRDYPNIKKSERMNRENGHRTIVRPRTTARVTDDTTSEADLELMSIFEQREAITDMCADKD